MLPQIYKISTLPLSIKGVLEQYITLMHYMILSTGSVLLKLGLLPLNSALLLPFCTVAHDFAIATATTVLQLPLNMLHLCYS